jgi:prepilin-type N-terminal cleavage/methylation domain-containing protein
MQKQKAFTLSEVLITLAVLGIIAAAVIPALITTTNKNNYVNALKRADLILKTATSELMADNSGTMQNLVSTDDDSIGMVNKYCSKLNCLKICDVGAVEGNCYPANTKQLQGINRTTNPDLYAGAVLSNGMMIWINAVKSSSCTYSGIVKNGITVACSEIIIDVNGFKGPNTFGRDIFEFEVYRSGILPFGVKDTSPANWNTYCSTASVHVYNGAGCAGRVLTEGKMNY